MTEAEYNEELDKLVDDFANAFIELIASQKRAHENLWGLGIKDFCRQIIDNAILNFKNCRRYPRKRSGRK